MELDLQRDPHESRLLIQQERMMRMYHSPRTQSFLPELHHLLYQSPLRRNPRGATLFLATDHGHS
jgi:hypothetical protein